MTDEIIAMAREADPFGEDGRLFAMASVAPGTLERFAALVEAQQPAPSAAWAVGNSGFDYQTAADVLNGKTVSDEAIRKFVAASRWAHDDRAGLRATLLSVRGELASREAEIALLKKALMEAEAAPQPSPVAQGDALDTIRLDWLDADESRCVFHLGTSWYTRPSYGMPYRKRASLRKAIDAARAQQENKP